MRHDRGKTSLRDGVSDQEISRAKRVQPSLHSEHYRLLTEVTKILHSGGIVATYLLQLGVPRFGVFQNGDVGVGVFPETEEILIGGQRSSSGGVGISSL
jgi:hypothetical protein